MSSDVVTDLRPQPVRARRAQKAVRVAGTTLLVIGVGVLLWAGWTWRWGDPFTSLYTKWQQHRLAALYDRQLSTAQAGPGALAPASPVTETPSAPETRLVTPEVLRRLKRAAVAYRSSLDPGDPVARLRVPKLDLKTIVVEGTNSAELRRGPGRDERTYMPGEGELSYIAGHRTTFAAPFAHIDRMRAGDLATLELPYGTLTYRVTGYRIVPSTDLSVLHTRGTDEIALQACHPRFFATQRYIVFARLQAILVTQGGHVIRYRVAG